MSDCIFCKITKSEVSAYKVYEDERVLAILDHRPVRDGHIMVIPKVHIDHFIDLGPDMAQHVMAVGHKLACKIRDELNPPRVGFVVSGFGISHAHFHVQPLWEEHDITSARYLDTAKHPPIFNPLLIDVADSQKQRDLSTLLQLKGKT